MVCLPFMEGLFFYFSESRLTHILTEFLCSGLLMEVLPRVVELCVDGNKSVLKLHDPYMTGCTYNYVDLSTILLLSRLCLQYTLF